MAMRTSSSARGGGVASKRYCERSWSGYVKGKRRWKCRVIQARSDRYEKTEKNERGGGLTLSSSSSSSSSSMTMTWRSLEYEEVAASVAGFCSTEMGRRKTLTSMMTFGTSTKSFADREETKRLLSETAAVLYFERTLMLPVDLGAVDTSVAAECIGRSGMRGTCSAVQLLEVARMVECIDRLKKSVKNAMRGSTNNSGGGTKRNKSGYGKGGGGGGGSEPPLPPGFSSGFDSTLGPLDAMIGWLPSLPDLSASIRRCISDDEARIFDGASKDLRDARSTIRELEAKIKRVLTAAMPKGSDTNAAIRKSTRGMLIAVHPSNATSSMVVMGSAGIGGKVLVRPREVSALNQRLATAMQDEKRAEDAVCRELSAKVTDNFNELRDILGGVEAVDFAAARARYSAWIQGAWPIFSDLDPQDSYWRNTHRDQRQRNAPRRTATTATTASTTTAGEGDARGGEDDNEESKKDAEPEQEADGEERNDDTAPVVQLERLHHPLLLGRRLREQKRIRTRPPRAAGANAAKNAAAVDADDGARSEPFDVVVSRKTRCIVITGANAGGKTTVLKALGLAVLMAQSGLYIPCDDTVKPAVVPWCDAVLADIGDGQSVVESLSTYSGHLTRIRDILASCTRSSLVLLDELGGGTDPADGAALATSILKDLTRTSSHGEGDANGSETGDEFQYADLLHPRATNVMRGGRGASNLQRRGKSGAGLTLCTTHTAELATLAFDEDEGRYVNAAVEVDETSFAPTYRLLWGLPGRSHALAVATRMFDDRHHAIIERARASLGKGVEELTTTLTNIERTSSETVLEMNAARKIVRESDAMANEIGACDNRLSEIRLSLEAKRLLEVARDAQAVRRTLQRTRKAILASRADEMKTAKAAAEAEKLRHASIQAAAEDAAWQPRIGELVVLKKLKKEGRVESVERNSLVIKMGPMEMSVKVKDVERKR